MRTTTLRLIGSATIGVGLLLGGLAPASATGAATVSVPDGFVKALSDTRATGHYEVVGTGLHLWTDGSTSTDKVAEYVATSTPLADAGEPSLDYSNTSGGVPGAQLVVDFDADGTADGILIGEPASYGNDWWASNGSAAFVQAGAPSHSAGFGSTNHGSLEQWRAAFPTAQVQAFGFSLGSGVKGDGTLNAIGFAGIRYTFVKPVVLAAKDECKGGGWATSTKPVFTNQGDCVSSFATAK